MTLRPSPARSLLFLCAIATLGFAGWEAIRIAWSDSLVRANTLESVAEAAELDPENADAQLWLAEHRQYAGLDPAAPILLASQLRPTDSKPRIRLALHLESGGGHAQAERLLLEAAEADRLYEPAWTLVNFYFRRGDREAFWKWADRALAMSYGDRKPLFDLCLRMSASTGEFASRVARHGVLAPALGEYLLEAADRAIANRDGARAAEAWKALVDRGLVRDGEVTGRGFGWQVPPVAGVRNDGLRFTLSGQQPERCELLWRWVIAGPASRVNASVDPAVGGLRWMVDGGPGLARLVLAYERPAGAMRYAGEFTVKSAGLE